MVVTRRNAASAEPAQLAPGRGIQQESPPPELPKKRVRKSKAASAQAESVVKTQSFTKVSSKSRAVSSSTTTTAVSTFSRNTRAAKAAGVGSPLRALDQPTPKRPTEKKRKRTRAQTASETPEPEHAQSPAQDENSDEQGLFFSQKFDTNLMHVEEASSAQPVFVNSSESAIALLHKIENAAKESARVEPLNHDESESFPSNNVAVQSSPRQSASNHTKQSATPSRPIASPSGFFSRSFSALKSKLGFATSTPEVPATPATPQVPSSTPTRPMPPPESITESLSVPPTPIGERVKTPVKKKRTNTMLKALLKGVEVNDKAKAEDWAKQVLPKLRNDPAFREKRKRLETPVLVKDLNHFPSSKPWETGFGDPLADLDDEDVVPGWAVFLDMMAEEEEHKAKKHKNLHEVTMGDDDILSINEQYAASSSAHSSPMLYDSHGKSASLLDFHPRRSIDPSPMFDTPVSHHQGANVFSELHGHDNAAQMRANDRESLQHATKETVHTHNPTMGSFSVPDDSDDEDSTIISESSEANGTPLWTQPPPPAPVPAHAPLPGGPAVEAASAPAVQQPVDEIERQRQRLMKHTPAKPSRLREATYPSPSLMSDAGNESILAATPVQVSASIGSIFDDIPAAETIELDDEAQAAFDALVNSDEYKQQLAADPWPPAILTYESDEEDLSPV
ncbi:hypothetical protein BKA66DRAFT_462911 [Pyrenochaeta sp. MPI-SDFR-AT-0127]|nr:hypothetical protein BKA66DRAFT_462911 [Pyrenochaeta sp. MPI-SDFR-AT-0127]